jgi:Mg2+ and Co2+ transporter CorA
LNISAGKDSINLRLRKGIWPLRNVNTRLLRNMPSLVSEETHRSSFGNRMNEVMKVLAMFVTIFIWDAVT